MGRLVRFLILGLALVGFMYVLMALGASGAEEMSRW